MRSAFGDMGVRLTDFYLELLREKKNLRSPKKTQGIRLPVQPGLIPGARPDRARAARGAGPLTYTIYINNINTK